MKTFTKIIIGAFSISCMTINAQTIILQEDFTNYLGTSATVPLGWNFSYNGNYTTSSYSGISPNSYKFGVNNATITSPMFADADTVSFWIKGAGTDSLSSLIILESSDSATWDTIGIVNPIPTTGATKSFHLLSTSTYLKYTYLKSAGNLAFDDFLLKQNGIDKPIADFTFTNNPCSADSVCFADLSNVASPDSIISWDWDFGDSQTSAFKNPCHLYSDTGTYAVTLICGGSNGNADTLSQLLTVLSCVGIQKINGVNFISLSPNPSDGIIDLNISNPEFQIAAINIYDVTGREIKNSPIAKFSYERYKINLSLQPSGIYFVKIKTDNKIIVEQISLNK